MKHFRTPKGIEKYFRRLLYGKYANWPKTFWFYNFLYGKAEMRVRTKAKAGEKLNVVFFVLNISMWKYESLFKLLLADYRFNPVIIPYPLLWEPSKIQKKNEKDIIEYCKRNEFPYKIGFDIDAKTYIPANELKADFVSFSQQYNNYPDFWKVERFYRDSLIFSYPYGLPMDNNDRFTHLLVNNVAWRIFYTNYQAKAVFEQNPFSKGRNFKWVGITIYDNLIKHPSICKIWKQHDPNIKRVIWAPHHTIYETDELPFSTFLIFADEMIEIAKEFEGRIQFVFKPHPLLKKKLISKWGQEKVDDYYCIWENMENTNACYGEYADLFMTSDALIHDCGGFMMEYLFTGQPALYLLKHDISPYISDISCSYLEQHYKAKSAYEIREFLEKVILNGNDYMASSRKTFYNTYLLPPNGTPVGENMYREFLTIFE